MRRFVVMCLIVILACASITVQCRAQNPQAVLSWGNSCPTVIQNRNWGSPGIYELWIGVKNLTASDRNVGSYINLFYGAPVADAWRFDDSGCQTSSQIQLNNEANNAGCPAMLGTQPFRLTSFTYDPVSMRMNVSLDVTYNVFVPSPNVTYTLWNIFFDHTYSVGGTGNPAIDCGDASRPLCISMTSPSDTTYPSILLTTHGNEPFTFAKPSDQMASWNMGCMPVPTEPTTWGRIKASYR